MPVALAPIRSLATACSGALVLGLLTGCSGSIDVGSSTVDRAKVEQEAAEQLAATVDNGVTPDIA